MSGLDVPTKSLTLTSVTATAADARAKTTLTAVFKVPVDAALKTLDTVGVELPWGWGPVLTTGSASLGAVSLSGVGSDGKALAANLTTVKVDAASVSRRALHLAL